MPKISIIIPVYNAEKYLNDCIDSIIDQSLSDIEIICVNDGSTDNSLKILSEYAKKDKRISFFSQPNKGAATARNFGIKKAVGDYLLILDADDIMHRDLCLKLYNQALKTDAEITICHSIEFDSQSNSILPSDWIIKDKYLPNKEVFNYKDIPDHIIGFTQGWSWDKLYKSNFVKDNNLEFQNLKATNDMYFVMLSLVLANKITVIKDVLIKHRQNNFSSISNTRDKNPFCFIEAIYKLMETLKNKNLYSHIERSFVNWIVQFCFWHLDTLRDKTNKKMLAKKLKYEVFNVLNAYQYKKDYFFDENLYYRIHSKSYFKDTKWYQFIFSIKNEFNGHKKHKVFTLFGIKIKTEIKKGIING